MSYSESNTRRSDLRVLPFRAEFHKRIQSETLEMLMLRADLRDKYMSAIGRRVPKFIEFPRDTTLLDKSDFAMMTKLSSGAPQTTLLKTPNNVCNMLINRQKGQFSGNAKCNMYNKYLPNKFDILVGYPGYIYRSGFTKNGQHFITASEDKRFRIYNSGNGSYNIEKSMEFEHVEQYITDLKCSPNNEHFAYSSACSIVNLCQLADGYNDQIPLVVDDTLSSIICSVSFSVDGRELLWGDSDGTIYIYDLKSDRTILKFLGHENHVNSIEFADDNILYTAGYDGVVKLWDRRTCPTPVGYLTGHRKEIMHIDLRGDGLHLITHSRDQTIKLWDERVLSSAEVANESVRIAMREHEYKLTHYLDRKVNEPTGLKDDTSIMTYRGHSVKYSNIRCRFSPVETTGQRYIYTGCDTGKVVVYDALTGEPVQHQLAHTLSVFDVSWHPTRNEMLSTGSDGLVGIWTYMDPNNMMEPEQIEMDRKHFSSFKFQDGLLLDPARKYNF